MPTEPRAKKPLRQYTDEELADVLDIAGLDEMLDIEHEFGYRPDQIADPETRRLWQLAIDTLAAIRERLDAAYVEKD